MIELLVVISVIGVLIALLMPAMAAARGRAQMAQCMAIMKGLHNASVVYGNDFRAVPAGRYFENQHTAPPPIMAQSWYSSTSRPWTRGPAFGIVNMNLGYLPKAKEVMWCPAKSMNETASANFFWGRSVDDQFWGLSGSPYAASGHRFNSTNADQYQTGGSIPMSKWDQYNKAYYMVEVLGSHMAVSAANLDPGTLTRPARHSGSLNVVFPPGQVISMPFTQLKALFDSGDQNFLQGGA